MVMVLMMLVIRVINDYIMDDARVLLEMMMMGMVVMMRMMLL